MRGKSFLGEIPYVFRGYAYRDRGIPGIERSSSLLMEKAHGIVTRVTKLGDTSLIVHWCSREAGLMKTAAAALRPIAPLCRKLDLFVEADLVWSLSRRIFTF